MRIGIYTLPLNFNYGGILQAYALQTVLKRMGHESIVLDRPLFPFTKIKWYSRLTLRNLYRKYVQHEIPYISLPKYLYETYNITTQYTEPFITKYINRLKVNDYSKLSQDDYDVVLCGSDQVWRRCFQLNKKSIYNAFIDFAKNWNVKRLSYAASFGVDYWEYSPEETEKCRELIALFDAISVRETSGVDLCSSYLGVNAVHVLDPTLLIDASDYINQLKILETPKSPGDMLVYILDENENKHVILSRIESLTGLKRFVVNSKAENYEAPLEDRIQPPVESWLRGFYDAKLVLTDSFHACVFSILFKKQFYVIANKNRGLARIESLLKQLNLEDRIVDEQSMNVLNKSIDYDSVFQKLEVLRYNSFKFLKENIQ